MAQFRALSPVIPDKVMLGFHFCFGTLGGWPRFAPDDLSATVRLANAAVEAPAAASTGFTFPCSIAATTHSSRR